jgi:predicted NAD-dependent protein-ADP-ribosyltransferase YbiA (DUF1768 family)
MDDTTFDILKTFYKGRRDPTTVYDYSAEGDLIEMDKAHKSTVRTILTLNEYRPVTLEEKAQMENARREAIAIATKEYDDAKKRLREEVTKPNRSDTMYLTLMREVRAADDALFRVRFPMRYIEKISSIPWRDLLFDEVENDARVIPYPLRALEVSPFPIQEMYVRIGKEAQKPLLTVKEIKKAQKQNAVKMDGDRPVILVSSAEDDKYGFLSLDWKVDITLDRYAKTANPIVYHSARQALAVELARRSGDQAHADEWMTIDSPEGIRYTLEDVPEEKGATRAQWDADAKNLLEEIQVAKFLNYPALGSLLLETGNARIGVVEPSDPSWGIGLAMDNPQAKNPIYWTGSNIIGDSLVYARLVLMNMKEKLGTASLAAPKSIKRKKAAVPTETASQPSTSSASQPITPPPQAAATSVIAPPVLNAAPVGNVQPAAPRVMRRPPKSIIASSASSSTLSG